MILIPVSQSNFWYDHGVSLISAIVTFLAFLLTFGALIYNSRKEKREAENRSKKTLSVLDFILENNNDELKGFLEQIKYIRKNTNEGISEITKSVYKPDIIEQWKKTRNPELNIFFVIDMSDLDTGIIPAVGSTVSTRFEKNYITLESYRYLNFNDFIKKLHKYEEELKTSLRNQHLNITSDSLEIISDRIQAIKESLDIFDSIEVRELQKIAITERDKTETEISRIFNKNPLVFIHEEHKKILNLEKELKKVIKPLSDGGIA